MFFFNFFVNSSLASAATSMKFALGNRQTLAMLHARLIAHPCITDRSDIAASVAAPIRLSLSCCASPESMLRESSPVNPRIVTTPMSLSGSPRIHDFQQSRQYSSPSGLTKPVVGASRRTRRKIFDPKKLLSAAPISCPIKSSLRDAIINIPESLDFLPSLRTDKMETEN